MSTGIFVLLKWYFLLLIRNVISKGAFNKIEAQSSGRSDVKEA